jgi:hypothetical protein
VTVTVTGRCPESPVGAQQRRNHMEAATETVRLAAGGPDTERVI